MLRLNSRVSDGKGARLGECFDFWRSSWSYFIRVVVVVEVPATSPISLVIQDYGHHTLRVSSQCQVGI